MPRDTRQIVFVGLGNPGKTYRYTRHNVGFMVVDELARQLNCPLMRAKPLYEKGECDFEGNPVLLIRPLTFMNRSGLAVQQAVEHYHLDVNQLLVISDDFHLPFGKIRFRRKGSDGGHKGLASIIECLKRSDFPRLRVGIGQEEIQDPVDFVLSPFDTQEMRSLPEYIAEAAQACLFYLREGMTNTMNRFN